MNPTQPLKTSGAKRWLWFVVIWLLSVAALTLVAWGLRWLIRA